MRSSLRLFTAVTAGAVATLALADPYHDHDAPADFAGQIGLQPHSVRGSFLQDPFAAMDMVAAHGITEVETVGTGQIDWVELITLARAHGVQHFFIEDESPDPLGNIPLSVAQLRGLDL